MPVDAWAAIAEKIRPLQPCAVHHQTVAIPVDIPSRWEPRAKQSRTVALLTALCAALRVAFADFSSAPWRGLEKSERCPNNSSLFRPQAAVVVVAVRVLYRPPNSSYSNPILYEKGFGYVFCLSEVLRKDYSER